MSERYPIRLAKSPSERVIEENSNEKIKMRKDPIEVAFLIIIFGFLTVSVYLLLGPISVIALGIGGALALYHLTEYSRKSNSNPSAKSSPSIFFILLLTSPFVIAGVISYEGITLEAAPIRIILLWAMMITFWSTLLIIPLAITSKARERNMRDITSYPKVSIIIPAYNEEKVIKQTIEAILETKYPKKEIILINDGSSDDTLRIALKYNDKIKVLHKENGGKASALNYGLLYATGDIVVIVDADTIVGRHTITEIVKSFQSREKTAAIAGNCKVRNRENWITKCQALEYIVGINLARRAFDTFGSVTIIPGAVGAFKKASLDRAGPYGKNTIVEDFDQTLKILKSGVTTQGSSKAVGYTEAPNTLRDFIAQRKRWSRGNIQVITRHSNALFNSRFGHLHKLTFPYMLIGMFIAPILTFTAIGAAIISIIIGDWWYTAQVTAIFTTLHLLMTGLALRIDNEDPKLMWYSIFLVFGYKQIIDILLIRAIIGHLRREKVVWTSSKRIGIT